MADVFGSMELIVGRQDIPGATKTAFLTAVGDDFSAHCCYTPGKIVREGIPRLARAINEKAPGKRWLPGWWKRFCLCIAVAVRLVG